MNNSNLNSEKIKRLKVRIIDMEKANIVNQSKKPSEMIEEIRKTIENEVKRCY